MFNFTIWSCDAVVTDGIVVDYNVLYCMCLLFYPDCNTHCTLQCSLICTILNKKNMNISSFTKVAVIAEILYCL